MTLKEKTSNQRKKLIELLKFLTNSKLKLFIFLLWIFSITSILIFPTETSINEDNIIGRISVASRVFLFFYTIFYLILVYTNSKREDLDNHTRISSKYSILVFVSIYIALLFIGLLLDVFITILFLFIILIEPIVFLVVPSIFLLKYIEKRNKPISHPSYYTGIILITSFFIISILILPRSVTPQFNFGTFEISFILIIAGSFAVILTIIFWLLVVKIRRLDQKSKQIKNLFIMIITFVALVMIAYRLLIYTINYELDVMLRSLSIGLLIFKNLLLIFIIFSIELNKAGDINDKSKSDKTYLFILLIQILMLYEERIYVNLNGFNIKPTWYPDLIIPIIIIPAIFIANSKLNKRYKKNPNALKGVIKLTEQKTNQYRKRIIIIFIVGFFLLGIYSTMMLQYFQG